MWSWFNRPGGPGESGLSQSQHPVALSIDEILQARSWPWHFEQRTRADGFKLGDLPGRRRGDGMELDSIGPYQPGDDVRHIDWHATARTGRAQSKRFRVEVQRTMILLIDLRASMFFGSSQCLMAKTACLAAARIAWATNPAQQLLGWICVGNGQPQILAAQRGRQARLRQLQQITQAYQGALQRAGETTTSLQHAIARALEQISTDVDLIIFSDFSQPGSELGATLSAIDNRRTHGVVIDDQMMRSAPASGHYPARHNDDPLLHIGLDRRARDAYPVHAEASRNALAARLADVGIYNTILCSADVSRGDSFTNEPLHEPVPG